MEAESLEDLEQMSGHEPADALALIKYLQRTFRDHGSRVPFLAELEMRAVAFAWNEHSFLERFGPAAAGEGGSDHRSWMSIVMYYDINDFLECLLVYFEKF